MFVVSENKNPGSFYTSGIFYCIQIVASESYFLGSNLNFEFKKWCTRRGSNSRPIAPEAIALSN